MGGYKEVDLLNKEFQKAQKKWLKMTEKVEQQKGRYHRVSSEYIQNDTQAKQAWILLFRMSFLKNVFFGKF